jgi:membrane protein DedA with SNARE-associated domain
MQILDTLIRWTSSHPESALLITFIMAFAESLIVVGGLIPGSIAITAIGVLAGSGAIDIYITFFIAILGAILGDGVSFFIGRHFKDNLKNFFIFKQYPRTLKVGKHYFDLHGGKSVFFGRFIGPVRAIVPAVAGMMGMPIANYLVANVLSAIGWSALFFIPGVLIGMGHSQIHYHFQQLLIILCVLTLPIICFKYLKRLKLNIYKRFREQILYSWHQAQHKPYLNFITPEKEIHPFFKTATEFSYLCIFFLGFLLSIVLANPFIHMSNAFLPDWLKHKHSLQPFLDKLTFMNDFIHLFMLGALFVVFILVVKQYRLLTSLAIILVLGTFLDSLLNVFNTKDVFPTLLSFNPFIISVAIQYLWIRCLILSKPTFYLPILILFITAWNIDIIFLTMRDQIPWVEFVFAGFLVGQIAWLHARFCPIQIKRPTLWLAIMILEMLSQMFI